MVDYQQELDVDTGREEVNRQESGTGSLDLGNYEEEGMKIEMWMAVLLLVVVLPTRTSR